ncbi:DNA methyltransferase [Janthinobacterium sp. NKUCC06_STL]|uniref:DNA methyltransferase n=1 Tax=Janthinobacterium sp. NKUCC06_STL TaxID=2842127 RepID=UPI00214BBCB3|nr:DNA methyltransferase [Janthinobacterium sp. NKUCC06_STL]
MRQIGIHRPGLRLIVLPLGVRQEFIREAAKRFTDEYEVQVRFIRTDAEIDGQDVVYLTNYESVREGKIDVRKFRAVGLDEASVLRSYGSKTYQEFLPLFEQVEFKFVYTATPSPNRFKELIHYAGFLGVMDTGQALTRFFQRDSEKAGNLTLYPHKEQEFWLWVASWAVFIQRPSDLGHSDEGYDLPALDVRFHEVPSNYSTAGAEKNGQGLLIPNVAMGLSAAAGEKRDSMAARVAKVAEIMAADPDDHFLIWHDLEDERHAIQTAVPGLVSVWGTQDLDQREQRIADFSDGKIKDLSTKPIIAGSGCNFQVHCHREIFAGIGFKFNDFIQAVHRVQRFQQQHAVRIDIIHTEVERKVLADLMEKWHRHDEMQAKMGQIIRAYGLDQLSMQDSLARTIGVERAVVAGERFSVANNDCVLEAMQQPDNSMGMIITSVPFANHYEYTPSYNDFGHTQDNDHFWAQMDFLTPELLRILQPGRIYACHVKDRINFGNVTGAGIPTVSPFHAEALFHGIKHGFDYMGMITVVTVVTDVVRENNQTYRLGYSEVCKDSTKMGVGSPEYILLFHKPQTDRSRGYADTPVAKAKPMCLDDAGERIPFDRKAAPIPGTGYSVARWQVDAHAFWRSSGDRLLGAAELASFGPGKLAKLFTSMSLDNVYNYEYHVEVGEALLAGKALPADYLSLAPGSADPAVWHDIVRMRTLNGEQSARAVEKHVCPFQIDIVDRLIGRYSNPGEVIYDPFCGLGTVPVRAMKLGRQGRGSELNPAYFTDQVHYCQAMEREVSMPTLFDMELMDEENAK